MDRLHIAPALAKAGVSGGAAASRLVDVIVEPRAAFRGMDSSPTWAAAFAALIVLRFGSLFAFYRPAVSMSKLVAGVAFQVVTVGPAVAIFALVLWTAAKLWSVPLTWGSALSVTVHVFFAYTLATVLIASAAGALLPATVDVDLRHPPFTSLEFLASADASPVVRRLLGAADARVAYAFTLTYLGVSAAALSEGAPGPSGRAARVVATCVGVYLGFVIVTG